MYCELMGKDVIYLMPRRKKKKMSARLMLVSGIKKENGFIGGSIVEGMLPRTSLTSRFLRLVPSFQYLPHRTSR